MPPEPVGDSDDDLALLRRYEPVLRFTKGELFLPAAVDDYVRCCELLARGPDGERSLLASKGSLSLERLVELGAAHPRPGQYLRFVDQPFTRRQVVGWRRRGDRPRFHGASRLARVGVLSRGIDALNRASLMFRGKVATGTEAAAETQYHEAMRPDHHPYYGRVVRDAGYTVLQYWFFYVFNDWRSRVYGVNDHEADWEQVTIFLAEHGDGLRPAWVVYSAHDEVGDDLRRRWDDPDLITVDDHPVVHPGLGSHSGAYLAGEYLTAYDAAAFGSLLRVSRRLSRTLLPWTRDEEHPGLSIPYIDYSRGDGVTIGLGGDRSWDPVLIDDSTPWVLHYRGLWGNDTEDPLGGERGPAGPRYERTAAIRSSWGDPIGWSGLRKVPPTEQAGDEALRSRLTRLDEEITALDQQIDRQQATLRAVVASGETVPAAAEAELVTLATRRVERRDERLLVSHRLTTRPQAASPHDHLRHRRVPLPLETSARRRVLAIWSAVSTSFVLGVIAAMLVRPGWTLATTGVEALVALFALEALARRQLARFAILLAVLFAVGWVALTVGSALLDDWRVVVAVPFALAAVALLVVNTNELVRD